MPERPKLGELLVQAGAINTHQLAVALAEQRKWGKPLGETLVALEYLDEETLVRTLARQFRIPVAWLRGKQIPAEVLELVPAEIAQKHRCLPLTVREEQAGRTLYLAMQDPYDLEALDVVRFHVGFKVNPILVAPGELGDALRRHYEVGEAEPLDLGAEVLDLETKVVGSTAPLGNDEPEFLTFEGTPQPGAGAPPGEPASGLTENARLTLTRLVATLVEEGVLQREELLDEIARLAASGKADAQ